MLRICLALLIIAMSAAVSARDVKLASANSGSCPESSASARDEASRSLRSGVPARETKAKPTVHTDTPGGGRLQSPRWHNFLPGMFR